MVPDLRLLFGGGGIQSVNFYGKINSTAKQIGEARNNRKMYLIFTSQNDRRNFVDCNEVSLCGLTDDLPIDDVRFSLGCATETTKSEFRMSKMEMTAIL